MQTYLNILEELKEETEKTKSRSWKWFLFWRTDKSKEVLNPTNDPEQEMLIEQNGLNQPDSPSNKRAPELFLVERRGSVWNSPTEQTTVQEGIYRKVLNVVRVLERDDGRSLQLNCPLRFMLTYDKSALHSKSALERPLTHSSRLCL